MVGVVSVILHMLITHCYCLVEMCIITCFHYRLSLAQLSQYNTVFQYVQSIKLHVKTKSECLSVYCNKKYPTS